MSDRKNQVIDSALQLFIEKGIEQTSLQDILTRAGISKGTFYNYFASKNECVLVILERARYEASLQRQEMLAGNDPTDIELLIKQISVLLNINHQQNLIAVYNSILHSGDKELKKMISLHRLNEHEWLAERFTDVFGEHVRPYSYEAAVLFYGMMQHISITWRMTHDAPLDPIKAARKIIQYIKEILPVMVREKTALLDLEAMEMLKNKIEIHRVPKGDILHLLGRLRQDIRTRTKQTPKNMIDLADVLFEELSADNIRNAVIESLLRPFYKAFEDTPFANEAREIAAKTSQFLKSTGK
ncbi:TetR/AcrR family transcriptional regulator [Sediminibacillus halophilus]|uniref:DNA-binding transcriptional regulator, AcrR family n=1 Tax=Sediminibacillus halophilus TaxID=482461 RepID=A0A1G9PB43_9BACI|nr:TetR/AcrR family transcriptional regulator [Sediminibacillus halophilus]SDL95711.1 DNA-binding transcriptional regulator, AcrR family [Sediminibacillus halophilus]